MKHRVTAVATDKICLELKVLPGSGHPVLYPEMREERQCPYLRHEEVLVLLPLLQNWLSRLSIRPWLLD